MQKCSYALEPFNLRLTVLRMLRNLKRILCGTLAGVLIFGGGYYLKNVVFGEAPRYESTITFKLVYTNPPVASGDYYINEMTWNTYVTSEEFSQMLGNTASLATVDSDWHTFGGPGGIGDMLSATVASDIHVPAITVSTNTAKRTSRVVEAVEEVMTGPFVEYVEELADVRVLDVSPTVQVLPDVRPLRAVILSAVLSFLFWSLFYLLREIGAPSIWLPATLTRRYGLTNIGTVNEPEFAVNLEYVFRDRTQIAVCPADPFMDPGEVLEKFPENSGKAWEVVPSPLLCPEVCEKLRQADGVLLVVRAGLLTGASLEHLLGFLETQEISVTGCLLWNADEWLLRGYYFCNTEEQG